MGTDERTERSGIITSQIDAYINPTQTVGTFTKLNNAFKVYNSNLSKSKGLQDAYVKSVGNQNQSLGKYLAGLNGTKATMGGYIASLGKAKLATIGLQAASVALNGVLSAGISLAIDGIIKGITWLVTAEDNAIRKAEELAEKSRQAFEEQQQKVQDFDDAFKQYNELQLSGEWDNTPLEQKKAIQEQINSLLGDEANKIDIINGKYSTTNAELLKQRGILGQEAVRKAKDAMDDAGKAAWSVAWWNKTLDFNTTYSSAKEREIFNKYGLDDIFDTEYKGTNNYRHEISTIDDFGDMLHTYNVMNEALNQMSTDGYTKNNSEVYKGISDYVDKFKGVIESYRKSEDEFRKTDVGSKVLDKVKEDYDGFIDTTSELSDARKWVEETFTDEEGREAALKWIDETFSMVEESIKIGGNEIANANASFTNEYTSFLSALEKSDVSLGETAISTAVNTLKEGLESGRVNSDHFNKSLTLLFGSDVPTNLPNALENLEKLLGLGENGVKDMYSTIARFTEKNGEINFFKMRNELELTDATFAAFQERMRDLGLLLANEYNMNQIGDGLGLNPQKSLTFESEANALLVDFREGKIGVDEYNQGVEKLTKSYGLASDAAIDFKRNMHYAAEGEFKFADDEFGGNMTAFTGVGGDTALRIESFLAQVNDEFDKSILDWQNADDKRNRSDRVLSYENFIGDVDFIKEQISNELRSTGAYTETEIEKITQEISNRVIDARIKTRITPEIENIANNIGLDTNQLDEFTKAITDSIDEQTGEINLGTLKANIEGVEFKKYTGETIDTQSILQAIGLKTKDGEFDLSAGLKIGNVELNATTDQVDSANTKVETLQETLKTINDGNYSVPLEHSQIAESEAQALSLKYTLQELSSKTHEVTVHTTYTETGSKPDTGGGGSGGSGEGGEHSVSGNAFMGGTLGAKQSGRSLVGELGQELYVDRSTGTWHTIGDNGAEFIDVDKGDIIFNAEQTKSLLENGATRSRGKSYAEGTAFAGGRGISNYTGVGESNSSNSKNSNSSTSEKDKSKSDKSDDALKKRMDEVDDEINDIKHLIEITQNANGAGADVVKYYRDIQKIANDEANKLRQQGFDDNSEEVQKLQKEWWDAAKAIEDYELKHMQEFLDMKMKVLDSYQKSIDVLDYDLELAQEDDYLLRTDLLNNKINQTSNYAQALREEFDRVANTVPKTTEEADALASQLEELGERMRDNLVVIRETYTAMQQLRLDALTSVGTALSSDLRSALNDIGRSMDILNSDNPDHFKYSKRILSYKQGLPTTADLSKYANARSNADRALILSTNADLSATSDMLEKQLSLNDNVTKEERNKVVDNLQQMKTDTELKLDSAFKIYDGYAEDVMDTTDEYVNYISKVVNKMKLTIPKPDASNFDKSLNEIEGKLSNVGTLSSSGNKLIDAGKKYLGTPYVWGGESISEGGMDCSGFVYAALKDAGYTYGRTTAEGYRQSAGKKIDKNDMQPGDLMFFGKGGEATHIAIYIGNDQMLESSGGSKNTRNNPGKGVIVSNIYKRSDLMQVNRLATGTSNANDEIALLGDDRAGNLNSIRPELVVRKDGVEVAGVNGAEFVHLNSGDKVIPYEKTKEILNRSGKTLPRYATGKPTTNEKYLKEIKAVCDTFDIPYEIALSLIDQESANGTASDTWRKNSAGAVGLTQITAPALGDFKETQYQITRDVLAKLSENGIDINNSRTEDESAYRDNIWTGIANLRLINDRYFKGNDSTWKKTLGWYYAGGGYNGSEGQWYANQLIDRANTQVFQEAAIALKNNGELTTNNSSQSTEKQIATQNQTELDKIEAYKTQMFQKIGDVTRKTRADQTKISFDNNLTDYEKQKKLYQLSKNTVDKVSIYGEGLYLQALDEYLKYLEETPAELYDPKITKGWQEVLSEYEDTIYEVEEESQGFYEKLTQMVDKQQSDLDDFIEMRNLYNDWDKFGTNEYKVIRDQMDLNWDLFNDGIISERELNQRNEPLQQRIFSLGKEDIDASMNYMLSEFQKQADEEKERLSFRQSQLQAEKTLLQDHYNIQNSIFDEQNRINKELKASQTMYKYLDENARKLMFNQKDYNILTSTLNDILKDANKLQKDYVKDIQKAEKENIDEITTKYQGQYSVLMKKYEIAKAELEVTKKRQQLDNALNERNVSMFINGKWQWVANTQDVINAENELADAEYAKTQAERGLSQENTLLDKQLNVSALGTQINNIDKALEDAQKAYDRAMKHVTGDVKTLDEVLKYIASSDCVALQNILHTSGDLFKDFYQQVTGEELEYTTPYNSHANYLEGLILETAKNEDEVVALNQSRNAKIDTERLDWVKLTDEEAIQLWKNLQSGAEIEGSPFYMDNNTTKAMAQKPNIKKDNGVILESIGSVAGASIEAAGMVLKPIEFGTIMFDSFLKAASTNANYDKLPFTNIGTQSMDNSVDNSITINGLTITDNSVFDVNKFKRHVYNHS